MLRSCVHLDQFRCACRGLRRDRRDGPSRFMTESSVTPMTLAAAVAARLVHDFAGKATGVLAGLDLSDDPELRDDGVAMALQSAHELRSLIDFSRIAFGESTEAAAAESIAELAGGRFDVRRCRVQINLGEAEMPGEVAGMALLLSMIGGTALATGGEGRLERTEGDGLRLSATGPRVRLDGETRDGLNGRERVGGLAGRWAPGFLLSLRAAERRWVVRLREDVGELEIRLGPVHR